MQTGFYFLEALAFLEESLSMSWRGAFDLPLATWARFRDVPPGHLSLRILYVSQTVLELSMDPSNHVNECSSRCFFPIFASVYLVAHPYILFIHPSKHLNKN